MKSEEEREQSTYRNSLAQWSFNMNLYKYISMQKRFGFFPQFKKISMFSLEIFPEGLMISVGKIRGQYDSM